VKPDDEQPVRWQLDKHVPVTWLGSLLVQLVLVGAFGQHVLDRVDQVTESNKALAAAIYSQKEAAADRKLTDQALDVMRARAETHDRQLLDLEVRIRELEQRKR